MSLSTVTLGYGTRQLPLHFDPNRKAEAFRLMLVSSLDEGIVRHMGLEPQRSLEAALAEVSTERGYIIPSG